MKTTVPHNYKEFRCIADRCRHSCCIGWEIDIDGNTLEKYRTLEGEIGESIRSSIERDPVPHFKLASGDRCPHLREDGLCRIIACLGEDALCDICDRHPRFFNYYEDSVEIGVGLCCEEACRILLEDHLPFSLESDGEGRESEAEEEIFAQRETVFSRITDKSLTFDESVRGLLRDFGVDFSDLSAERWAEFYLSLERLDEAWTPVLEKVAALKETRLDEVGGDLPEGPFKNIFAYFVYRYTPRALEDGGFATVLKFAAVSTYMIRCASVAGGVDLAETLRMYSSEVEYSSDNLDEICFELSF